MLEALWKHHKSKDNIFYIEVIPHFFFSVENKIVFSRHDFKKNTFSEHIFDLGARGAPWAAGLDPNPKNMARGPILCREKKKSEFGNRKQKTKLF